jgi:hypothetical protein
VTLGQKQRLFARLVARLIRYAERRGYEVTFGETYRHPEWAEEMRRRGKSGVGRRSLHCSRLAIDLNLFRDGRYLTRSEDYAMLGAYWERRHPLCRWGGHFGDGNHFSLEHGGVK